uniref:Cytochrome b6-f complex subunit 6 n=1 Tax=Hommersandiophycus borowitzkae TaxID=268573 RepID=A0A1G4NU61_9FLOR|nr:Cytochrome b6-f complex subunit 6 [Hommersandiophycus borowitzkae]SCW22144.1 Cytochrome b6-f complex subunit 6 [Hommersandiophycus borowitzkae]
MSIFISYLIFLSIFMGLAIGLFFSLQSVKLI